MYENIKVIALRMAQLDEMVKFAQDNFPIESCMLLFGKISEDQVIVEKIEPTENINNSTVTFEIDPEELYRLYTKHEKDDRNLIGVFHSHPAPTYPSQIDIPNMKINQVVWLILGGHSKEDYKKNIMKGYIWRDESVQEIIITVLIEN